MRGGEAAVTDRGLQVILLQHTGGGGRVVVVVVWCSVHYTLFPPPSLPTQEGGLATYTWHRSEGETKGDV